MPDLLPHTLLLCLAILLLLTMVNIRGVRTSGIGFLLPTYVFVFAVGVVVVKAFTGGAAHSVPAAVVPSSSGIAWLVVRAFANGCTAMTGVEAVSNAVPVFRRPTERTAQRTLTTIIVVLGLLVAGIAAVCHHLGITAKAPGQSGYESILSQIAHRTLGHGVGYGVVMVAVITVLCLSANTSFADFPRLCRVLALDGHLPDAFAHQGPRLVYNQGIILLTLLSGALLIAFGGVTDRLIPLFAVGAFLAFTLSQLGMVFHWKRLGAERHRGPLVLNAVGAGATSLTLIVVAATKFLEGAWLTLVFVPLALLLFDRVHKHYLRIDAETAAGGPLELTGRDNPNFLHGHTATLLKTRLLFRGGPQVVIVSTPWHARD